MRIPDTTLERLNAQADIVAIIKKHTALKPAGREFKGCCPFHGEKTPSFYVNPQTNLYYCFGCGVKGNAITFLREYERMSFIEAVEFLADQTGIDLPKNNDHAKVHYKKSPHPAPPPPHQPPPNAPPTDAVPSTDDGMGFNNTGAGEFYAPLGDHADGQAYDGGFDGHYAGDGFDGGQFDDRHFDGGQLPNNHFIGEPTPSGYIPNPPTPSEDGNLYTLLTQIAKFYQAMLHATPAAMQYFSTRGLSADTIAEFELGYAPSGWQHLEQAFPHDIDGLKLLGLVRTSQKGRNFDLLRERVIFPIKDRQGRIVGFAGRALGDELPKYINSSESPVFSKQHILYGLYEARQARATDYLVVEGYMDVIALHQAGIYGAVAPMGTAVNDKQIERLLKYNDTLTLCFDGDKAGQKAAWRTLEVAAPVLPDGKALKFLTLSNGHDPDTFIKAYGADATRDAIRHARTTSEYVYDALTQRHDTSTPEGKALAMAELKELTAKFPKGSSFKWWLNSDIYQKLRGKPPTHTAELIRYDSATDPIVELALCVLYAPTLVQSDPLSALYRHAQVDNAHAPLADKLRRANISTPPLPTWQDIDGELGALIAHIAMLLNHPDAPLGQDTPASAQSIDTGAQLIMASLRPSTLQTKLRHAWREFLHQNQHHRLSDVRPLFDELLCQVVTETLKRQRENSKSLILSEIYKRRIIALSQWDNDQKSRLASEVERL